MVVLGHRLLTGITYQGGHLSGLDALDYVSWGRWVTLLFQVMPVFLPGRGLRERRLLDSAPAAGRRLDRMGPRPGAAAAVAGGRLRGRHPALRRRGPGRRREYCRTGTSRLVRALHLWFLPVCPLLIALTLLLAAHRRWGLAIRW
jgi:hypothetical protein